MEAGGHTMKAKRKHRPGLSEHIQNNAECLRRLILIVSIALPHTTNDISALMSEWVKIHVVSAIIPNIRPPVPHLVD